MSQFAKFSKMSKIAHRAQRRMFHSNSITVHDGTTGDREYCAYQAMHHMPQPYTRPEPSLLPIERPRCPKCQGGRMMLARIEPGPAGSDMRTFECPKCNHTHRILAEDAMKLVSGWQNSGLSAAR